MFRSDAPLPEVYPPLHQTPSSHMPFVDSHPDPANLSDLSDQSYDEGAALAEDAKGKVVGSLGRGDSPEAEVGASCPKKPRIAVQKRKVSGNVR